MRNRIVLSLVVVLAALVVGGCPKSAPGSMARASGGKKGGLPLTLASTGSGDPLAKVGTVTLTVGEVQDRLNKQSPFVRARYQSPEKLREFVDNQVRFEVLAQEAFRRDIHLDAEVQDAVKKIMVQKLTRDEFDGRVKLADITDAEMQAYYDSHADEYNKPEMIRASVIKVGFGADKAAAEAKAKEAHKAAADPAKLADRNHFKDLVVKYTTDEELKRTGGDIRYLSADEIAQRFGPGVKDAAWSLAEVNDVSGVVEGTDAFFVIKKTGIRKPITRTFDQVKNQIRNLIFREKRNDAFNAYVEELKRELGVEVFPDQITKIVVDASGGLPPPGAEGADPHGDIDMDVHGGAMDPHAAEGDTQ